MDHKLVISLAEQAGIIFNTDALDECQGGKFKGSGAFPHQRRAYYEFAKLILENRIQIVSGKDSDPYMHPVTITDPEPTAA